MEESIENFFTYYLEFVFTPHTRPHAELIG